MRAAETHHDAVRRTYGAPNSVQPLPHLGCRGQDLALMVTPRVLSHLSHRHIRLGFWPRIRVVVGGSFVCDNVTVVTGV